MRKGGFFRVCSRVMTFILTAGLAMGVMTAVPDNAATVYAKDGNGDVVVVIDPGHGGYDGGAHSATTGDNESDLNWGIAKYMKAELETYAGVRVYVTRANNEWNTNTGRAHMGKSVGADAVISIHNNSSGNTGTNGFVAYGSVVDGYSEPTKNLCLNMARYAQAAGLGLFSGGYLTRTGTNPAEDFYTVIDEGTKSGIPTIIAEHSFMTNASDSYFMHETENQRKVGVADATAVAEYFGLSKRTISDGQGIELDRSYSAYFVPANQKDGGVSFSSSDENVAHVRSDGLITAVNAGTATITYTYADGTSGSCTFTTKPVVQVGVSAGINPTVYRTSDEIAAIDKSTIIVKAIYSDGTSRQQSSGYNVGDIDPYYEGRQYVNITHNGFSASLLIRLDTTAEIGTYSKYLYQTTGEYADIFTFPELVSIEGVSGSPYTSNGFENEPKPTQPETTTQAQPTEQTTAAETAETTESRDTAEETTQTATELMTEAQDTTAEAEATQETEETASTVDATQTVSGSTTAADTTDGSTSSDKSETTAQATATDTSKGNKEKKSMDWIIAVLIVLIALMVALIVFAAMSIKKNNRYNRRLEQRERRHREELGEHEVRHQESAGNSKRVNEDEPKRRKR